jgi:hypothetical protein
VNETVHKLVQRGWKGDCHGGNFSP